MMMMWNPYANISSCPIFVSLLLIMLGPSPLSYLSIIHLFIKSVDCSFFHSLIFPLTHSLFHSSSLSVIHLITHLFLQSTNQSINQFITQSHSFSFIMLLGSRDQENGKTWKQTGLMSFTQILNMKYYKMVFP